MAKPGRRLWPEKLVGSMLAAAARSLTMSDIASPDSRSGAMRPWRSTRRNSEPFLIPVVRRSGVWWSGEEWPLADVRVEDIHRPVEGVEKLVTSLHTYGLEAVTPAAHGGDVRVAHDGPGELPSRTEVQVSGREPHYAVKFVSPSLFAAQNGGGVAVDHRL